MIVSNKLDIWFHLFAVRTYKYKMHAHVWFDVKPCPLRQLSHVPAPYFAGEITNRYFNLLIVTIIILQNRPPQTVFPTLHGDMSKFTNPNNRV